jgi:L-threonylcarbamoyladenylate synthase
MTLRHEASQAEIEHAARALEAGLLVALPTETVYGLGADAENPDALAAIYAAKGRPQDHPVIVHIAPGADLGYWASAIPDAARQLAAAFWPGPLTMILERAPNIPDTVSGGQDTVGIRCPSHPVAVRLLQAFKGGRGGIAAPSANKFGHVSPTTAAHVRAEFGDDARIAAVLEGGQSEVGIESTIVDLSRLATHGPVLLRPGHISSEQIAAVIGQWPARPDAAAPRASGTLESHYAPRTPVALLEGGDLAHAVARLHASGHKVAVIHYRAIPVVEASMRLPFDPSGYAHALYAALRAMDEPGAAVILVEATPQDDAWLGVNDRLRRAAHGSAGIVDRLAGATSGA